MKFHAQLLEQEFSNSKEPSLREEILLTGQGIHSPSPHQHCSLSWGAGSARGKAVMAKPRHRPFSGLHRARAGHSSHYFHFEGAAFLSVPLLFVSALLLRQLNAFD